MMETTTSPIRLTLLQIAQLLVYCTAYRSYLWQCTPATSERNQALRSIQALQGRLEKAQEQGQPETMFQGEDRQIICWLLSSLTRAYSTLPASQQRTRQLGDVAVLRRQIGPSTRQTRTLSGEQQMRRRTEGATQQTYPERQPFGANRQEQWK